ncbi:polysaccharide deacetylase family protein [Candidatus Latescibacterota bacterium]
MNEIKYTKLWRQAAPIRSVIIGRSRAFLRGSLLSVFSALNRTLEPAFLRCLFCHYVFDDQKDDFERIISSLKKNGQFIDTDTCIEMLQGKRKIDKRYYHLSFDDGFHNNFTNAFPILRMHEVPAIFFVPSSLIGASYDDTKKYCLETTRYNSVIEMLKWSDLREMLSHGYEIGSHTKTHARFSSISDNIQLMEDEVLGSKLELESNLDYECKYISWPYGTIADADKKSLEMTNTAGYTACFGAFRGSVEPGKTDMFSIPRHQFEAQWPLSHVLYFARGNMEVKA